MKPSLVLLVVGTVVFTLTSACDGGSSSSSSPATGADAGLEPEGDAGGGGGPSAEGVDCAHPGAGEPLGGDRCACATTRSIAGEWTAMRTCREGDLCPTRDKEEVIVFTQDGTSVRGERADGYALTGTLCGDALVWTGARKDGLNPECGTLRLTDDGRYVTDSCYVASGACTPSFNQGCGAQKGQCTGTGAKKPEAPASIQRVICSS